MDTVRKLETRFERQYPIHVSNGPVDCEFCTKIADMKREDPLFGTSLR